MKKRFLALMMGLLAPLGFVSADAQTNPTVRVPLCLQNADTDSKVYCTGVVPVDKDTGNALSWGDAFGGNQSSATADPSAGSSSATAKPVQNADGTKLATQATLAEVSNKLYADTVPLTVTPRTSTGDLTAAIDTTGYRSVSLQLTTSWVATVALQQSQDGIIWTTTGQFCVLTDNATWAATFTAANRVITCPVHARYIKLVVTAYTSGTVNPLLVMRLANLDTSTNAVTVSGTVTANQGGTWNMGISAGTNTIGNVLRAVYYNETTTALAAGATFTGGTARDSGAAGTATVWNNFSCWVRTDQVGTLNVQASNDGTTWYIEQTQAITAGVPVSATGRTFTRYHRCQVINTSASAQTQLFVNSQFGE